MAEVLETAAPEPQGSTVHDAASALEARWTAAEEAAATTAEEAPAAEVPAAEAPPEAEETGEAPEETEPEPEAVATLYTVKVDGEERQVPVEELVKGYQFGADYTRKTQKLAETRKAAEAELESAREERALYAQLLPAVKQLLESGEQPPDLDKLYEENPTEAARVQYQWNKKQTLIQQTRSEQQWLAQIQQQAQAKAMQKTLEEESARLIEAIPEWKDSKTAKTEKEELVRIAKKAGYTEDEFSNITDHRAVVILRKAMLYDKMQDTRKALKPATPVIRAAKPGAQQPPREVTDVTRAKQRLAQTGSLTDAADALEKMLT